MRNAERADGGRITEKLLRFADIVADDSPLYSRLMRHLADDAAVLGVLGDADHSQPAANIILAAVQYLLLEGEGDELAAWYPALSGVEPSGDPVELFRSFVQEHEEVLRSLVATHTVQTNEVRRCTTLLPSFATVAAAAGAPLALIEIGPSAGLNLVLDRYRYDYGPHGTAGPASSPLTLTTEVRSGSPPVRLPEVAWRIGVDLRPLDVTDPDAVRWARALLWPEQTERVERFAKAVEIAAADPPPLVQGAALEALPGLVSEAPDAAALTVFHSYVLNQFSKAARAELDGLLRRESGRRRIDRIGVEVLERIGDDGEVYPRITHTTYDDGTAEAATLGKAHYHGAWLEWAS